MMAESESRVLAKLLAGFSRRQVHSAADLEAWVHEAHELANRLDTDFAEATKRLSDEEWWYIRHYLDDADVRMKEPGSAYARMQNERLQRLIARLESA